MRLTYADAQDTRTGAHWSLEQKGYERAMEFGRRRRIACTMCRKKNMSDALGEVPDETRRLRKRIAWRLPCNIPAQASATWQPSARKSSTSGRTLRMQRAGRSSRRAISLATQPTSHVRPRRWPRKGSLLRTLFC